MDLPDKSNPAVGTPKKKVKPLIAGAEERNRPITKRFVGAVFNDSPREVASRVALTVLLPQLKAGLEAGFNSFVSGMLWGGATRPPTVGGGSLIGSVVRGGGVAYSQVSTQSALERARQAAPPAAYGGGYRDLVVPTIQDAETLLAGMYDLLNEYRVVAVGDLYEMANRTSQPSDNAIGWRSLDGARISAVSGGFVLELPRPSVI